MCLGWDCGLGVIGVRWDGVWYVEVGDGDGGGIRWRRLEWGGVGSGYECVGEGRGWVECGVGCGLMVG